MVRNLTYRIKKGAAQVILCGALAVSAIPMTAYASTGDSGRLLEAQFEDEEGFRLFRYRTLKALNTLRDVGMTPQAIVQTLSGNDPAIDGTDAADTLSGYTSDIADAVTDKTQEIVQDATDAAMDAARQQMNNWVDSLGWSIGQAIRDAIDNVLGIGSEQ